jgi:hypothetical protein
MKFERKRNSQHANGSDFRIVQTSRIGAMSVEKSGYLRHA